MRDLAKKIEKITERINLFIEKIRDKYNKLSDKNKKIAVALSVGVVCFLYIFAYIPGKPTDTVVREYSGDMNKYDFLQIKSSDFNLYSLSEEEVHKKGNFKYIYSYDEKYTAVVSYTGKSSKVKIPEKLGGVPVVGVTDCKVVGKGGEKTLYPFENNSKLKRIELSEKVTFLGKIVENCPNLEEVSVNEYLKSVGNEAFINCKKLKTFEFPERFDYVGDGAFSGCESLKSEIILNDVKYVGVEAFKDCTSLVNVWLETYYDGEVKERAFVGSSVENLYFSSSDVLPSECFMDCKKLKNIELFSNITEIKSKAFANCVNIEKN